MRVTQPSSSLSAMSRNSDALTSRRGYRTLRSHTIKAITINIIMPVIIVLLNTLYISRVRADIALTLVSVVRTQQMVPPKSPDFSRFRPLAV